MKYYTILLFIALVIVFVAFAEGTSTTTKAPTTTAAPTTKPSTQPSKPTIPPKSTPSGVERTSGSVCALLMSLMSFLWIAVINRM